MNISLEAPGQFFFCSSSCPCLFKAIFLVNPFTLNILTKIHVNTSVCLPYISYKFCCENLVLDQVIFPLLTDNVFPILMPWLSHIVLILYGEILSWSLQDSNQFSINCNPKNLFTQNLRVGTFRVA